MGEAARRIAAGDKPRSGKRSQEWKVTKPSNKARVIAADGVFYPRNKRPKIRIKPKNRRVK